MTAPLAVSATGETVVRMYSRERRATRIASPIDGVIVSLDREANDGWPGEQDNILRGAVIGSSGSDVIRGNEEGNSLAGGAGRDRIFGWPERTS